MQLGCKTTVGGKFVPMAFQVFVVAVSGSLLVFGVCDASGSQTGETMEKTTL